MATDDIRIRPATREDGDALGRFGGALARQHHAFDPARFMLPDDVEAGYREWLLREAKLADAVVLVAERAGAVVGYAYGRLEPRDWNLLREACGAFHDLWVDASVRRAGVGLLLAEAMVERLRTLGARQVVLHTAATNAPAQKLFSRLGWRASMVEMTRDL